MDSQILGTAVQNLDARGHQDLFTLAHRSSAEPGFTQQAPCFGREITADFVLPKGIM